RRPRSPAHPAASLAPGGGSIHLKRVRLRLKRAAHSVCSLPRLRGRAREGACTKIRAVRPLPNPPPQAGEGGDRVGCSRLVQRHVITITLSKSRTSRDETAPPPRSCARSGPAHAGTASTP